MSVPVPEEDFFAMCVCCAICNCDGLVSVVRRKNVFFIWRLLVVCEQVSSAAERCKKRR